MRTALERDGELLSPSVGTWLPAVAVGAPVSAGDCLGHLLRAGRRLAISAPKNSGGRALTLAPAGSWLAAGDSLATVGAYLAADTEPDTHRPSADPRMPPGAEVVTADTDGTVFLRPEPAAALFAPEGSAVTERSTLALVEVMKTFSPVRAPVSGTVATVLVDDATAVSEGDALFWIVPA